MKIVRFYDTDCVVISGRYSNKRIRWDLQTPDGEPIACATVNLPDEAHEGLDTGTHVLIKDWSENHGMVEALMDAGYIVSVEKRVPTGFVWAALCRRA